MYSCKIFEQLDNLNLHFSCSHAVDPRVAGGLALRVSDPGHLLPLAHLEAPRLLHRLPHRLLRDAEGGEPRVPDHIMWLSCEYQYVRSELDWSKACRAGRPDECRGLNVNPVLTVTQVLAADCRNKKPFPQCPPPCILWCVKCLDVQHYLERPLWPVILQEPWWPWPGPGCGRGRGWRSEQTRGRAWWSPRPGAVGERGWGGGRPEWRGRRRR